MQKKTIKKHETHKVEIETYKTKETNVKRMVKT